jgi:hypothetical protein
MWHIIQHWLSYMTGSENTSGAPPNYNFWSGFGSDIAEVTIVGALVAVYKKHNCHARWCWRVGHHEFFDASKGLTYNLCRKHHPDHPGRRQITKESIASISEQATP